MAYPPGTAALPGTILGPTDPVLASGIQSEAGANRDRERFSHADEGALNDGSADPLVLPGLGLLGLHPLGTAGRHWLAVDLLWSPGTGFLSGAIAGGLTGALVVYLRIRHQNALGLENSCPAA